MPREGSQLPASPSRFKMKHHETEPSTPKEIQKITEPVTTMDKSSNVRSSGHTIKMPIIGYIQNRLSRRLLSFGESWRCNPTSGSCCTRTKFIPKCILKFIGHLTEIWYSSISTYIPTGTVSGLKCICCALFISQFLVDQHGLSNARVKDLTENQERAAKNKHEIPFPVFLDASELLMYKIMHQKKMGETPGTYTQQYWCKRFCPPTEPNTPSNSRRLFLFQEIWAYIARPKQENASSLTVKRRSVLYGNKPAS